jgi:hypothetical protein
VEKFSGAVASSVFFSDEISPIFDKEIGKFFENLVFVV